MIWEALGATALGLLIAHAATRQLHRRLPDRALVLVTGPSAALLGGLICRIVLGEGYALVTLAVAAVVSVAILSLLIGDNVRSPHGLRPKVVSPPQV
jgi:ABC-type proline/glycine betaine transport system permease subunit